MDRFNQFINQAEFEVSRGNTTHLGDGTPMSAIHYLRNAAQMVHGQPEQAAIISRIEEVEALPNTLEVKLLKHYALEFAKLRSLNVAYNDCEDCEEAMLLLQIKQQKEYMEAHFHVLF
jgi:hypothetical protein